MSFIRVASDEQPVMRRRHWMSYFTWEAVSRTKSVFQIMSEVADPEAEAERQAAVAAGHSDAPGAGAAVPNPLAAAQKDGLKKCLTRWDVMAYGVGSTVGAGIFVTTYTGAQHAGPIGVVMSFVVASVACMFSAFAYAEFSARVPVSGSAYTFSYVCLGELAAWFVGWNLTLEYAISAAAVARGWSDNVVLMFNQFGWNAPSWLNSIELGSAGGTNWNVSLLSVLICAVCTVLLLAGAKESANFNKFITVLNVCVILFIIILGAFHMHTKYWTDAIPAAVTVPAGCSGDGGVFPCGFNGILAGAAKVFFAYIGFDSVTTLAEEVIDPKVDLPIGIIGTLVLTTGLYVGASAVVTGMVPWYAMDPNTPLASAFQSVGVGWATTIIAICTVTALTASTLCSLFGQPRIFFRMAKDGLLFELFARVHPQTKAPLWGTLVTGVTAGLIALFMSLDVLTDMISIGTLMAFTTVCAGVVLLRCDSTTNPSRPALLMVAYLIPCTALCVALRFLGNGCPVWVAVVLFVITLIPVVLFARFPKAAPPTTYACPFVPFFPLFGMFCNLYLICSLSALSYIRILVWTIIGFALYFGYGIFHSKMWGTAGDSQLLKNQHLLDGSGSAVVNVAADNNRGLLDPVAAGSGSNIYTDASGNTSYAPLSTADDGAAAAGNGLAIGGVDIGDSSGGAATRRSINGDAH